MSAVCQIPSASQEASSSAMHQVRTHRRRRRPPPPPPRSAEQPRGAAWRARRPYSSTGVPSRRKQTVRVAAAASAESGRSDRTGSDACPQRSCCPGTGGSAWLLRAQARVAKKRRQAAPLAAVHSSSRPPRVHTGACSIGFNTTAIIRAADLKESHCIMSSYMAGCTRPGLSLPGRAARPAACRRRRCRRRLAWRGLAAGEADGAQELHHVPLVVRHLLVACSW